MKLYLNYAGILFFGIGLGILGIKAYDRINKAPNEVFSTQKLKNKIDPFLDGFFDKDFFKGKTQDPFSHMKRMQKNLDKLFEGYPQEWLEGNAFDDWFNSRFGGSVFDIEQSEDEDSVYYTLIVKNIDRDSIKVSIKDKQVVVFDSYLESNPNDLVTQSEYKRSFPIPFGVDEEKVSVENTEDGIVIKFPKIQSFSGVFYRQTEHYSYI